MILRDRAGNRLYSIHDANWNASSAITYTGVVQERYSYAAYGRPTYLTVDFIARSPSELTLEFLYSGYRYDVDTQFYTTSYRSYDTLSGTWCERDLLGYLSGMNLFAYCSSRPLNSTDPLGLETYGFARTNESASTGQITTWLVESMHDGAGAYFNGIGSDFNYWLGTTYGVANPYSMTGQGMNRIATLPHEIICNDVCNDNVTDVNLVGWSRGAVIALEVARRLRTQGCCCKAVRTGRYSAACVDSRIPNIPWIGLVDPVRMTYGSGFGGTVPAGVGAVSVATTSVTGFTQDRFFPPLPIATTPGCATTLNTMDFNTTHQGIGADWDAYYWMVKQAKSAGVNAKLPGFAGPPVGKPSSKVY